MLCPEMGICLKKDAGCRSMGVDGVCLKCSDYYVLHNGRCLLYPPGVLML